jgi:galactose-1-phosphate uridylyltransferase
MREGSMRKFQNLYLKMTDGTLKHINPLTGTEVWTVPDRAHRPLTNRSLSPPKLLEHQAKENYCDFCTSGYFRTPPEKSRLIQNWDGHYQKLDKVNPDMIDATKSVFRRVANLFEIVTIDYWVKNHGFKLSLPQSQWMQNYLDNPKGWEHVSQIIYTKLRLLGKTPEDIESLTSNDIRKLSESFFGGAHELIIAGRHFKPGATTDHEYYSSGEMSDEEHYWFMQFTIEALTDIYQHNPFIRYVTIFQNWLQPAGASLDHLHKQLVGLDEWGTSIQAEVEIARDHPNIYNDAIINFSAQNHLIFAENDHAIALAELGHRFPTLAIYSKSKNARPEEHTPEELRGFSDLVHACHAAMGSHIPCNEEWYYSPRDAVNVMPWHILIKWRTVNQAGFEGGTKIYINPLSPVAVRDIIVPRLYELRHTGKLKNLRIATECVLTPNPLQYCQNK